MAEALNVSGKTDILIREHDENLFIAECKIWKAREGRRPHDGGSVASCRGASTAFAATAFGIIRSR
jgi:hypothetical protein